MKLLSYDANPNPELTVQEASPHTLVVEMDSSQLSGREESSNGWILQHTFPTRLRYQNVIINGAENEKSVIDSIHFGSEALRRPIQTNTHCAAPLSNPVIVVKVSAGLYFTVEQTPQAPVASACSQVHFIPTGLDINEVLLERAISDLCLRSPSSALPAHIPVGSYSWFPFILVTTGLVQVILFCFILYYLLLK